MSFVIGYITGAIITAVVIFACVMLKHNWGSLRIDRSDPDEPPCIFLELYTAPSKIMQKKYVILKVKTENFITHE